MEATKLSKPLLKRRSGSRKPWGPIILFIAPAMIYYAIFILYPVFQSIYNSFHTIAPFQGEIVSTFVGLDNYTRLLTDDIFILSVKNTLIWGLIGPTIEMLVATTLAIIVYFEVPLHRFFRVAWFTPLLVSGVIVGLVFRWIFNFDWGLLNAGLRAIGLDNLALNWLGRRDTPLYAVIFVHFWSTFGYSFVLLLAGLSTVPKELIEAARIDGASTLRVATSILLPLLRPTFVTVALLSFMGKMRAFNVVWVLTGGGPMHFSETVATYVQKQAFTMGFDLGYPSAIAVVWFGVILLSVGLLSRWLSGRAELQS